MARRGRRFPIVYRFAKELSRRIGLYRYDFFSSYRYMYEPDQLMYLLQLYKSVADVPGAYVEVGCAYGATTVLLKKYDDRLGLRRRFVAMDTFSGFVKAHADHDIAVLKRDPSLRRPFKVNSVHWLRETLTVDGVTGVEIVKGDATRFDYATVAPVAFCLIDLDLNRPIIEVLPRVYRALAPGGIIVVDDCAPHELWEGALVAFREFTEQHGLPADIACEKLGIVSKPRELAALAAGGSLAEPAA